MTYSTNVDIPKLVAMIITKEKPPVEHQKQS